MQDLIVTGSTSGITATVVNTTEHQQLQTIYVSILLQVQTTQPKDLLKEKH